MPAVPRWSWRGFRGATFGLWRNGRPAAVSLDSVVHAYWQGRLPEAIVADFPSLTLEQVHGAIAFYLGHRAEIDAYLSEQDARWEQFQQESAAKHAPLLRRVRGCALPAGS
jgi:hypothetical protein